MPAHEYQCRACQERCGEILSIGESGDAPVWPDEDELSNKSDWRILQQSTNQVRPSRR